MHDLTYMLRSNWVRNKTNSYRKQLQTPLVPKNSLRVAANNLVGGVPPKEQVPIAEPRAMLEQPVALAAA